MKQHSIKTFLHFLILVFIVSSLVLGVLGFVHFLKSNNGNRIHNLDKR